MPEANAQDLMSAPLIKQGDETLVITLGTTKDGFLIAYYRYSFVKSDDTELAALLGVYGDRFKYNVSATGNSGDVTKSSSTSASSTLPLPLIGASFDWYINPRWKISGNVQGTKVRFGDYDGHAIVASALTDYTLLRNLGIGIRYIYSDVSADVTKSDFNGDFNRRMNSVSLYA